VVEDVDLRIVLLMMDLVCVQDEIGDNLAVPYVCAISDQLELLLTLRWRVGE
jgi:hypothetical protein